MELCIQCHWAAHVRELEARKPAVLQEEDVVLAAEGTWVEVGGRRHWVHSLLHNKDAQRACSRM